MTDETIDKILKELQRVEQILLSMRQTGKVSDIERDIVLAKLRTMYEFIQFFEPELIDRTASITIPANEPVKESNKEVKSVPSAEEWTIVSPPQKPAEITPEPEAKPTIKPEPPIVQKTEPEPVKVSEPVAVKIEPVKETPAPIVEKQPEIKPKTEILAEKFEKKSFLNETLAQYQNQHDLSRKFQHTPLKDIFSAMSLNDRFLFIKQLFNNDTDLFQKTIEKLNTSGSFNDAVKHLDGNFQWDFNETQVQKLLDLVHRRYLSHE